MKRRDFIKGCCGSVALLAPFSAFADEGSVILTVRDKIEGAWFRSTSPDTVEDSDVEWISGYSDGSCSTFDSFPDVPAVLEPPERIR